MMADELDISRCDVRCLTVKLISPFFSRHRSFHAEIETIEAVCELKQFPLIVLANGLYSSVHIER